MRLTVQELIEILQEIAPESLAEKWDNVGLLIGNGAEPVGGILLALDPTLPLLSQAKELGANVIITHHPAIFHPLKRVTTDTPGGQFIASALVHSLQVIGCHTNLDATSGGVSDALASALGLSQISPLLASDTGCLEQEGCGLGRIGRYDQPVSTDHFLERLCEALRPPWLLEAGVRPAQITTAAVCGGSCGDFTELAKQKGADVFLTSEVKHSVACWARDAGFWVLDGGHFATEYLGVYGMRKRLSALLKKRNYPVTLHIASQQSPLQLVRKSLGKDHHCS